MAIPKKKRASKASKPVTLAQWLVDNDKTQLWLADQLGISIAQASRIVRGVNMPRAGLALRIQELTGISIETLARARAEGVENKEAMIRHGQKLIARGSAILEAASAK